MTGKKPSSGLAPTKLIKDNGRSLPPTKLTVPMPAVKPPPPSPSDEK